MPAFRPVASHTIDFQKKRNGENLLPSWSTEARGILMIKDPLPAPQPGEMPRLCPDFCSIVSAILLLRVLIVNAILNCLSLFIVIV
jgi:hypothetical protein